MKFHCFTLKRKISLFSENAQNKKICIALCKHFMKFLLNSLLRKMPKNVSKETAKNVIENIPSYIKKKDEYFLINLRVKPNSKNTSIYFNSDKEVLNINIQEQPINNQSNVAIIEYFSDILHVKKRDISIVSGLKSRDKVLMVSNISLDDLNSNIIENVE
ncbi:conserved protein, unknown function [Plasmodium gonderi]|uniref:Uncharacterized protein n=1 Tax=Plasmodium gonderi TaxID=77519 RepID=A0A1Y1JMR7_PLAGO|nr:conserved protein, unknown function [Plasmodium gonderi]GAW82517.1 conserved protein, unknown function [Plasmodium gonderi]